LLPAAAFAPAGTAAADSDACGGDACKCAAGSDGIVPTGLEADLAAGSLSLADNKGCCEMVADSAAPLL